MTIVVNGSGTITGISQGGLNDNIITQSELANTGVAGNGPAFSAYQSTLQSLSQATYTKIQLQSEEFDTANCFDSTTNYRFTPNVAGYYIVTCALYFTTSTAAFVGIYKNGSEYKRGQQSQASCQMGIATALVYLNGSTDYVEAYAYQNSGSAQNSTVGSSLTYFQGSMARAA